MDVQIDICPMGDPEAKKLEYDVYLREGYSEANSREEVLENIEYPDFIHFVARVNGEVIGALRLVVDTKPRHGLFRLASFGHFSIHPWVQEALHGVELKKTVEVGTMVIKPEYRGGETYTLLFQKAFEYCLMKRLKFAMSTIDENFFNRLIKRGMPFKAMGERRYYMGSYTIPAIIDLEYLASMIFGPMEAQAQAQAQASEKAVNALAS